MFNRHHYKAVADVLKAFPEWESGLTLGAALNNCIEFADMFEKDNPNFDRHRFLDYCDVEWLKS